MSYLIDTHAFLWYVEGDQSLPAKIRKLIQDEKIVKFVSKVSLWEIAIKLNKEKLLLSKPFETLPEYIHINGFTLLPIQPKHLFLLKALPKAHGDPFDHLLIAQAISEEISIISGDRLFKNYPAKVMW